ncbi:hypothetical protein PR048_000003 [Dryococelus australis]|uniref:Uncharacterized protein n=1 Tax=Dryococelus australis TaxID=614101 RepID=A0ABQ9IED6_9NEOP|nr:hypothetical protein PR048_000003 [Dryococelus australis]
MGWGRRDNSHILNQIFALYFHGGRTVRMLASHQGVPVQSKVWPLVIFASGNRAGRCRWSAGFLGDLPLHSGVATFSPRFTLIGSQDLDVKSHPHLSTQQQLAIFFSTLTFRRFVKVKLSGGRGGLVVRLRASHLGGAAPGFPHVESHRTKSLVDGFSRGFPISPALAFRHCTIATSLNPHLLSRLHISTPLHNYLQTLNNEGTHAMKHHDISYVQLLQGDKMKEYSQIAKGSSIESQKVLTSILSATSLGTVSADNYDEASTVKDRMSVRCSLEVGELQNKPRERDTAQEY